MPSGDALDWCCTSSAVTQSTPGRGDRVGLGDGLGDFVGDGLGDVVGDELGDPAGDGLVTFDVGVPEGLGDGLTLCELLEVGEGLVVGLGVGVLWFPLVSRLAESTAAVPDPDAQGDPCSARVGARTGARAKPVAGSEPPTIATAARPSRTIVTDTAALRLSIRPKPDS